MAFINGFKHTISEKMFGFLGHVHVELYDPNHTAYLDFKPIEGDKELAKAIKATPHVHQVAPFALRPAILRANGEMEGIQLKGVNQDFRFAPSMSKVGKIDYSDSAYSRQILLSQTTADRLKVKEGDTLQLYFLESGGSLPRIRKVQVAGLYHTGVEEIDKFYAVCDLRLLQRINGWQPGQINGYQVDCDDPKNMYAVNNSIHDYLNTPKYAGKSSLESFILPDIYPSVFEWLNLQDVNGKIILTIMSIVAIINLAAALMILIVDQSRMIGMMKTLGMNAGNMRQIFLYYSGLIAGAGILAGNLLGLGVCALQQHTGFLKLDEDTYYMKYVPVRYSWGEIAVIDIATLVLCIVCMWLPTLYIRRILPAKVLQFK